jgi:extradiol dioxygenase family protein
VDGKDVPIPHFGIILEWEMFNEFSQKLKNKNVEFVIEPYVRFKGLVGEQATMFFKDPSGNALEFKSFKDSKQIFAK